MIRDIDNKDHNFSIYECLLFGEEKYICSKCNIEIVKKIFISVDAELQYYISNGKNGAHKIYYLVHDKESKYINCNDQIIKDIIEWNMIDKFFNKYGDKDHIFEFADDRFGAIFIFAIIVSWLFSECIEVGTESV